MMLIDVTAVAYWDLRLWQPIKGVNDKDFKVGFIKGQLGSELPWLVVGDCAVKTLHLFSAVTIGLRNPEAENFRFGWHIK